MDAGTDDVGGRKEPQKEVKHVSPALEVLWGAKGEHLQDHLEREEGGGRDEGG